MILRSASRAPQAVELQLDDRADLLAVERLEHDDLVDAVHELGPEVLEQLGLLSGCSTS